MSPPSEHERLRRRPLGRYRYTRLRWRVLFAVIDGLGAAVFGLARRVRATHRRLRRTVRCTHATSRPVRTILLVQLDHFGDAVISTVLLPALRTRYPEASIEVLAGPWNRDVFEAAPEVDRVHVSRWNRFARSRRFGWPLAVFWWGLRLRRRRIDLGIDVRGEFPLALLLWLAGARRRLGWAAGGGGFLLTDVVPYVHDRPEVESRLALLEALDIRPGEGETWRPVFRPSEAARQTVARRLGYQTAVPRDTRRRLHAGAEGLTSCRLYAGADQARGQAPRLVLHVGAGMAAKKWPVEHWRALVAWLVDGPGARVVLVGSGGDREVARRIVGPAPRAEVADWTGTLSIAELGALLEAADVFVGADSGPAHLAAAVATPVVALFSGTNNPRQWQPCGENVLVLRHLVRCSPCHRRDCPLPGHPCMRGLSPARVSKAVEALLQSSRHTPRDGPASQSSRHAPRDVAASRGA